MLSGTIGKATAYTADDPDFSPPPASRSVGRSTLAQSLAYEDAPRSSSPLFASSTPEWETIDAEQDAADSEAESSGEAGLSADTGDREADSEAGPDADIDSDSQRTAEEPEVLEAHAEADDVAMSADDSVPAGVELPDGSPVQARAEERSVDEDENEHENENERDQDRDHDDALDDETAEPGAGISSRIASLSLAARPASAPRSTAARRRARAAPRAPKHPFAKNDRYNRVVKANHVTRGRKDQLDRAGVRLPTGRDTWQVVGAEQDRYQNVAGVGRKVDSITNANTSPSTPPEKRQQIAVNPARSRKLKILGAPTECAFVWKRSKGAGWMPINKLENSSKLRAAISRSASRRAPAAAKEGAATSPFHFASGGSTANRDLKVKVNKSGGDKLGDYLEKNVPGRTSYFNISQALPQSGSAPVATDFAQPNDTFFVLKGSKFRHYSYLFKKGSTRATTKKVMWVFGYLAGKAGKQDRSRRGWVPMRVLKTGRGT